jgi:hypothetical protein
VVEEAERDDKPERNNNRLCKTFNDNGSLHYVVEREAFTVGNKQETSPCVNVWWNREGRKVLGGRTYRTEALVIRQENGRVGADVILLTPGQVYDLIDALNKAVDNP